MEILQFIFVLGINFSIFGFIWGLIMFVIRAFQPPGSDESFSYIFRIIKYFLLVSVTANFIVVYEMGSPGRQVDTSNIIVGSIVLGLYLLGKFQNRALLNQFARNPMFAKFMPKIDPKVEVFLLFGSVAYFVACLLFPAMVNNNLINWFTNAINSIYETPIIGWIFSIIAFFFLISIIMRGINVIGRLLSGQSLMQGPPSGGSFHFHAGGTGFEDEEQKTDDGFTDYEDVTDDEDQDENKIE
ncbi:MAG: hypothetical protein HUJ25_18440 [Crocinitomicaceae bacterium]|nr:hypothetical protein [Crocinitomicaceae bacterium]